MKIKFKLNRRLLLFSLIFFLCSTILVFSQAQHTKSFTVQKNGTLKMSINPGDITLTTWDKMEAFVKLSGVDEDDIKNDIEISLKGNTVYIESKSSFGWMGDADYNISIPKEFNVEIKTTSGDISLDGDLVGDFAVSTAGGDVVLNNVNGNVKVYTSGGDINAGNIEGNSKLNTQGGDIRVGDLSGDEVSINTMGGDIRISNVKSDIEVKTYGGDIGIGNIGGSVSAVTYGGDIDLSKVTGSAYCETYGGNISLESASGEVKANTYGGNINLLNVTGSIRANTQAGNIYVELNPSGKGDSKISSSSGKVTLALPASAKATVHAEISLHGWWKDAKDEFEIQSDFESKTYVVSEDDKEVRAEYVLNGGGDKIQIKTINSEIVIKKLTK